jgi:hypothetical protein
MLIDHICEIGAWFQAFKIDEHAMREVPPESFEQRTSLPVVLAAPITDEDLPCHVRSIHPGIRRWQSLSMPNTGGRIVNAGAAAWPSGSRAVVRVSCHFGGIKAFSNLLRTSSGRRTD